MSEKKEKNFRTWSYLDEEMLFSDHYCKDLDWVEMMSNGARDSRIKW